MIFIEILQTALLGILVFTHLIILGMICLALRKNES